MSKEKLKVAIAIDIGHSRVKYGWAVSSEPTKHYYDSFPTMVMEGIKFNSEDTYRKAQVNRVELNGKEYYVGDTAATQSHNSTYTGYGKDWVKTTQHDLLLLSAWKRVQTALAKKFPNQEVEEYMIHLGLPTSYFLEQKGYLLTHSYELINPLLKNGERLNFLVKSQSETLLSLVFLQEDGAPNPDRNPIKDRVGFVEVGHNTTDYDIFFNGEIIQNSSSSSKGAYIVYEEFGKHVPFAGKIDLISEAIEENKLFYKGAEQDYTELVKECAKPLQDSISEKMKVVFADHRDALKVILLAGGGANLIYDRLKKEYPDNLTMYKKPRMAVVESFLRSCLYHLRKDTFKIKEGE